MCSFCHLDLSFLIKVYCEKLLNKGWLFFLGFSGALGSFVDLLVKSDSTANVLEIVSFLFEGVYHLDLFFLLLFICL